jgi:hypothetical protein
MFSTCRLPTSFGTAIVVVSCVPPSSFIYNSVCHSASLSIRARWTERVPSTRERRSTYWILMGKPKNAHQFEDPTLYERMILKRIQRKIMDYVYGLGTADGGSVVKVLCYKSEGRWFDSRWCHWNFLLTWSFRLHCGPGFDSASNRNEYQEHLLGVKAAGA